MPPDLPANGAIRAVGLVRRFDDFTAVDGIDLDIQPGEIYGFLGPNGAGKSTTVRVLCTLITPDGGSATVAGYDVATQPEQVRLRIGVALQDAALDPKQTGVELLQLQGRLYGLRRKEITTRLREVRELVDIGDAMERPIGTYSGGMKRRLDLAAALIHNPEILFLDEPTTGLDPVSRVAVWQEVRRYRPGTLTRLLADAGLAPPHRMKFTFASVFPLMLAVRVTQRLLRPYRPLRPDTDIAVPPAPVNALLTGLLRAEAALSRHVPMPIGSSLLVVARKGRSG